MFDNDVALLPGRTPGSAEAGLDDGENPEDEPPHTPGSAEGDLKTIEEDLARLEEEDGHEHQA